MAPAEPERLRKSKAMRKEHEEEGRVAEPPAPFASRFNELPNFLRGEVLAFAWPAGGAGFADFSLYASWGGFAHSRKGVCFPTLS